MLYMITKTGLMLIHWIVQICKKCHNLKPSGLADFTGSAVLQSACGSRLQLHALRLASPANSTIAQFRLIQFSNSKYLDRPYPL